MGKNQSIFSILLISLFFLATFFSIRTPSKEAVPTLSSETVNFPEWLGGSSATLEEDQSTIKGVFLHNVTGCIMLNNTEPLDQFYYYCHIPIVYPGQAPIIINDIWTEPVNKVTEFLIVDNYSGDNFLAKVRLEDFPSAGSIKLFWSAATIVKQNNCEGLPQLIPITPEAELPADVLPWLASTAFIQANHPEIQAKATELVGSESNLLEIAERIADFTANEIVGLGWPLDALSTLHNMAGSCTGRANLAAALLRAMGIPARILFVTYTHFIVECYAHPYGWIWLESSIGYFPCKNPPRHEYPYSVRFVAYPEDETTSNFVNGQNPYGGVIAYCGASNAFVVMKIAYDFWSQKSYKLFSEIEKIDGALYITEKTWDFYASYLGSNLSLVQEQYFLSAIAYQKTAMNCFADRNFDGYIENIIQSYNDYTKIENIITTIPFSPFPSPPPSPTTPSQTTASAGIVIGSIAAIGLIVEMSIWIILRRKKEK